MCEFEKECLRVMKGEEGCALVQNAALLEDVRDIVEKFVKKSKEQTGGGKATIQLRADKKLLGGGWPTFSSWSKQRLVFLVGVIIEDI